MKQAEADLLRHNLDVILKKWRRVRKDRRPRGWIRDIREALRMSNRELAARVGVVESCIANFQIREAKGTITLETLRRIGMEMNCRLVYALVPIYPLEKLLANRKRHAASNKLWRDPELKKLSDRMPGLIDTVAGKIKRTELWQDKEPEKEPTMSLVDEFNEEVQRRLKEKLAKRRAAAEAKGILEKARGGETKEEIEARELRLVEEARQILEAADRAAAQAKEEARRAETPPKEEKRVSTWEPFPKPKTDEECWQDVLKRLPRDKIIDYDHGDKRPEEERE